MRNACVQRRRSIETRERETISIGYRMAPIETQQPAEFLGEKSKKKRYSFTCIYEHVLICTSSLSLSLSLIPLVIHHHHHPLRFYSSPLFL
jgi:hypothetical protein